MPDPRDVLTAKVVEPTELFQICSLMRGEANHEYHRSLVVRMAAHLREKTPGPRPFVRPTIKHSFWEVLIATRRHEEDVLRALRAAKEHRRMKMLLGTVQWRAVCRMIDHRMIQERRMARAAKIKKVQEASV